ncbi:MAG: hypothetical protein ACK42L_07005 [Thermoanaerobaculum sp.]
MKKILSMLVVATLTAGPLLAQQRTGVPQVNPAQSVTVTGEVVSFQAGVGQGTPTLTLKETNGTERSFVLGPFRYVQSQGFVAHAGDQVEVLAYACSACPEGLVAAQVKNLTRGVTLVLRGTDGRPLWMGQTGQGGAGKGSKATGMSRSGQGWKNRSCAGPDMSRVTTFTGSVRSFTGAFRQGTPTVTLDSANGQVPIILSPFQVLVQADYLPAVGAQLEVVAAPVTWNEDEYWVAISIKDLTSGLEIQLRDANTGLPLGGWGRY